MLVSLQFWLFLLPMRNLFVEINRFLFPTPGVCLHLDPANTTTSKIRADKKNSAAERRKTRLVSSLSEKYDAANNDHISLNQQPFIPPVPFSQLAVLSWYHWDPRPSCAPLPHRIDQDGSMQLSGSHSRWVSTSTSANSAKIHNRV